jgi:hypothetical protein
MKEYTDVIIHRYEKTCIDMDKIIPIANECIAPLIESLNIIVVIGCCGTICGTMLVE